MPSTSEWGHHYRQCVSVIHGVAWSRVYCERTFTLLNVPHNYAVIIRVILRTASELELRKRKHRRRRVNATRGSLNNVRRIKLRVYPAAKWQQVTLPRTTAFIRLRF